MIGGELDAALRAGVVVEVERDPCAAGRTGRLFFFADGCAELVARAFARDGAASALEANAEPIAASTHAARIGPRPMGSCGSRDVPSTWGVGHSARFTRRGYLGGERRARAPWIFVRSTAESVGTQSRAGSCDD